MKAEVGFWQIESFISHKERLLGDVVFQRTVEKAYIDHIKADSSLSLPADGKITVGVGPLRYLGTLRGGHSNTHIGYLTYSAIEDLSKVTDNPDISDLVHMVNWMDYVDRWNAGYFGLGVSSGIPYTSIEDLELPVVELLYRAHLKTGKSVEVKNDITGTVEVFKGEESFSQIKQAVVGMTEQLSQASPKNH